MLNQLAQISGIYVPAIHGNNQLIKKRIVADLNSWSHPINPVVPLMQTVHDRIILEIARGCTRGCRFCQAGMIWRPYRERNAFLLMQMAEKLLSVTGHDEISLLSLSSGDYSCLEFLIKTLMKLHYSKRVALALPSLRVESLTGILIEEIKKTRKTSFTLAPEAGTDKMRRIINKGNTAGDLISVVYKIFAAGWKSIKLYFMLGLPYETQEDLEGIIELSHQVLKAARKRGQVTISLSTFIPKPHTPFQWEKQISLDEIYIKQDFFRRRLKDHHLNLKWHDAKMSLLEGMFSRGSERLGELLEKAFLKGCRFDGWTELLRFDIWQEAMDELGTNPEDYLREREINEILPWGNIDCGVSHQFLLQERNKSAEAIATADCRFARCQNCGVCDFLTTKNVFAEAEKTQEITLLPLTVTSAANEKIYRFTFNKLGRARFLSHRELSTALIRSLRRSSLALVYSSGYHPHPKVSFAIATPVGMESREEYMDITAMEYPANLNLLKNEINSALPRGIEVIEIKPLSPGAKTLAQTLYGFIYELYLPTDIDGGRLKIIKENIEKFLVSASFKIQRISKGKTIIKDMRPFVESINLDANKKRIEATALYTQKGSVRPFDIIIHVLGYNKEETEQIYFTKTKTLFF